VAQQAQFLFGISKRFSGTEGKEECGREMNDYIFKCLFSDFGRRREGS
jgi:hypothetical protein